MWASAILEVRDVKAGWTRRVLRRASWDGGGIRAGRDAAMLVVDDKGSLSRPSRRTRAGWTARRLVSAKKSEVRGSVLYYRAPLPGEH